MENMDWLEEEIGDYENDYLIIDCPGPHFVHIIRQFVNAIPQVKLSYILIIVFSQPSYPILIDLDSEHVQFTFSSPNSWKTSISSSGDLSSLRSSTHVPTYF